MLSDRFQAEKLAAGPVIRISVSPNDEMRIEIPGRQAWVDN